MIIPAALAQVNLQFSGLYLPTGAEVTFGVDNLSGELPAQIAADVATSLASSTIENNWTDGVTLSNIHVKNGPNATGPSADVSQAVVGDLTGAGAPPNVAFLVHKHTALGGRKGRGRLYWPGVAEGEIDGAGQLFASRLSAMQTDLNAFLTALSTNGHAMYLLHNDATAPTLVTSLVLDPFVATQRQRLRR